MSKITIINPGVKVEAPKIRQFSTGATRDANAGKFDYEGFLSPRVIERYAEYMNRHRIQSDGKLRDSDNWQKGIPKDQYMKSLWRHFMDLWKWHRGIPVLGVSIEEALCAILFNTMGYLHECLQRSEDRVSRAAAHIRERT